MDFHFSRVSSVPLGLLCRFCCIVHMRLCHRDVGATIYNEQRRNDDPQHVHEHKIEVEIERVSIFAVYVTVSVLDPEVEQDSIQLTLKIRTKYLVRTMLQFGSVLNCSCQFNQFNFVAASFLPTEMTSCRTNL